MFCSTTILRKICNGVTLHVYNASFHRWISHWLDIVQWIIQSCPHHKVCNRIPLCPHFCSNWLLIGLNLSKWMRLPCSPIKRPHTSCQTKIWFCPDLDIQHSIFLRTSLTGTFDNKHFLWFRDMFAWTKCFWKCTFEHIKIQSYPFPFFLHFQKARWKLTSKSAQLEIPIPLNFARLAVSFQSTNRNQSSQFRRAQELEGMRL